MESIDVKLKLPKKELLVIGNLQFNSSDDYRLIKQDQDIANQDLNESEDNKNVCLQKLRQRLESIPNMRCCTDDAYLIRFLRWTKYDCDKAYIKIKKLYLLRNKHPELFLMPSNLYNLVNNYMWKRIPYRDEKGRMVYLVDYRKWNLDEMPFDLFLNVFNAVADIESMNPHIQVNGLVGIWDFRGLSMRHASLITHPFKLWLFSIVLQDCYPWRVQQIIGINCNSLIMATYSTVRMFLKKKIAKRIKMLGSDMNELHQYVNPAILPKEYGGTLDEREYSLTGFTHDNLSCLKYERSFGVHASS